MSTDEKLKMIVEHMECKHKTRLIELEKEVLTDTKMPQRVANKIMQAEGLREKRA